ncbi:MAG: VWA domain-containing protein [Acidobacteriota bacterium]|nr:VWA domain-containing protein [Acidobacteriota bacterium]
MSVPVFRIAALSWLVVVTIAAAPHAAGGGQQPAPAFRAGIDLITFEATALDRDGVPVRDLGPEDFSVTVGGRPRKVVFADFHGDGMVVPAGGSAAPARESRGRALGAEGRIVVIVVDRDSLAPGNEAALLEAATAVIDGLQPADAVGLVGVPVGGVDLTRDHDRVRAALPLMSGTRPRQEMYRDRNISWDEALAYERGDSRVIAEVIERECYRIPADPNGGLQNRCPPDLIVQARELLQIGRAHVETTTSVLESLAAKLAPLRGSKHVILISGGLQFGQDLLTRFQRFSQKAAEAQLTLYAVHLDQPDSNVTDRRTVTSAFGGREATAGLGALTGMTGGRLFMGVGRATGVFDRITTEINNFYVLGVESGPEDASGSPRSLEVTVKRPGLTVRSRPEVAPRPSFAKAAEGKPETPAADPLMALLNQPTDISELAITATAYSTRGTEESTLRVLISAELSAERARLPADWAFAVFNDGNVVATGQQTFEAGTPGPLVMTTSAKLLPGRYRLRVAARDADGRAGVVDVPLAAGLRVAGELQLSDLVVGISEGGRLLPRARVTQGTPVSALIELMSADPDRLAAARAVIEVIPAGTAEPVRRFLMAVQTVNGASVIINAAEIDTSDLPPGRYTASVVATVDGQPVGRVSRVFEVVPAP